MRKKICAEVNLQVGKVHPKIFDIVVFSLPILLIGGIIGMVFELVYNNDQEVIQGLITGGLLLVGTLVLALVNAKRVIYFRKCYKDGVILPAIVKIIDRKTIFLNTRYSGTVEVAKILVEFEYKGETIVRRSGKKELAETYLGTTVRIGKRENAGTYMGTAQSGYQPYYFQYDGQVNILYSEKYDEVFILKD